MAWLYQQKGKSKNWFIGLRVNGKLRAQTTGTADKAQAEKELAKINMIDQAHKAGSLTEEFYRTLTGATTPKITLHAELDDWLKESQHQTASNTWGRYNQIADEFRTYLKATATAPMLSDVTTARVAGYLMHKRASTAASTTNVVRKILAGFFKRAVANNRLRENPVSPVKPFKAQKGEKTKRRSFTIDELKEIYAKAPDDFWRYMIVGGAYTGLRMGDLICMKWGNVDLQTNFLKIEPDKVEGKEISIPIRPAFRSILANLKASAGKVKPADYLWPEQAAKHARYVSKSGYFSNQFYNTILEPCGLVPKREVTHKKKENSTGKRQVNDISFHCLRHFFISTLKATGSNQAVAKALAGHSSDQVNDLYTHVPEAQLTIAINQLPEFVK